MKHRALGWLLALSVAACGERAGPEHPHQPAPLPCTAGELPPPGAPIVPLATLVAQSGGTRSVARARVLEVRTPDCPPCPPEVTCSPCEPPSMTLASAEGPEQTASVHQGPAEFPQLSPGSALVVYGHGDGAGASGVVLVGFRRLAPDCPAQ